MIIERSACECRQPNKPNAKTIMPCSCFQPHKSINTHYNIQYAWFQGKWNMVVLEQPG